VSAISTGRQNGTLYKPPPSGGRLWIWRSAPSRFRQPRTRLHASRSQLLGEILWCSSKRPQTLANPGTLARGNICQHHPGSVRRIRFQRNRMSEIRIAMLGASPLRVASAVPRQRRASDLTAKSHRMVEIPPGRTVSHRGSGAMCGWHRSPDDRGQKATELTFTARTR